jgi:hypothetical protein
VKKKDRLMDIDAGSGLRPAADPATRPAHNGGRHPTVLPGEQPLVAMKKKAAVEAAYRRGRTTLLPGEMPIIFQF